MSSQNAHDMSEQAAINEEWEGIADYYEHDDTDPSHEETSKTGNTDGG